MYMHVHMTQNRSWNRTWNNNQIKCRNRNRLQIFRFRNPAYGWYRYSCTYEVQLPLQSTSTPTRYFTLQYEVQLHTVIQLNTATSTRYIYVHLQCTTIPTRYIYAEEVHLQLQVTSTPTMYSYTFLKLLTNTVLDGTKIRTPATTSEVSEGHNVTEFLNFIQRIWFRSGIKKKGQIRILIKMVWIRITGWQ